MLEFIESSAEAFKSVVVVGVELIADVSSFCSAVAVVAVVDDVAVVVGMEVGVVTSICLLVVVDVADVAAVVAVVVTNVNKCRFADVVPFFSSICF